MIVYCLVGAESAHECCVRGEADLCDYVHTGGAGELSQPDAYATRGRGDEDAFGVCGGFVVGSVINCGGGKGCRQSRMHEQCLPRC